MTTMVGGQLVLRVVGELDSVNKQELEELEARTPSESVGIVIDLAGLRRIDAGGMRLLMSLRARLAGRAELRGPRAGQQSLLEFLLLRLDG